MKYLKIKSPVTFLVGNHLCVCRLEGKEENYPVALGVNFQEEHYGFILQKDDKKEIYPTETSIKSALCTSLFLRIFETNQKSAWKINARTGEVLNESHMKVKQ